MKLVKLDNGAKHFITGNKKFSLFLIDGVNLTMDPKRCEDWMFSEREHVLNFGERILKILTRSEEEYQDLFTLFQRQGFKVRHDNHPSPWSTIPKNREYLGEENYCDVMRGSSAFFVGGRFLLYLTRKQVDKFQDFLRTLSKDHNYKTVYGLGRHYDYLNVIIK